MALELVQAALKLAAHGYAVFPCAPRGKQPITANGCKDATRDPEQIRAWWQRTPAANIGIATGKPSGIVVLDVDEDEDKGISGGESLKLWEGEFGALPDTWQILTGGGGTHYLFRTDREVRNRAGMLEGVDVRGDGGYIIAPPSIHPSGRAYVWEESSRDLREPAPLPEELYLLMTGHGREGPRFELPARIGEGQRNDLLFRLAASLQAKGLSDAALYAAVQAENVARCQPPLPEPEVRALIESALRYDKGEDRELAGSVAKGELDRIAGAGNQERATLLAEDTYRAIFALQDMFEREQYIVKLREAARKNKCMKDFDRLLAAYRRKYVQGRKQQGSNRTRFTDASLALACKDWICDDLGVRRMASRGEEVYEEWACPHPILPVERLVNLDQGTEKLRLAYCKDGAWRTIVAAMTTVASRTRIVELAEVGVAVTTENAKYLVEYLHDVLNANLDAIPQYGSVGRMGWVQEEFAPYMEAIKFDGDLAYKEYFEAVREQGDFAAWRQLCREAREDNPIAKILLGASCASPAIELLGKLPFFVHLWGGTEAGKTVALMLAMSVWGNPEPGRLVRSWNATSVGLERSAAVAYSIPLALDELQTIRNDNDFDRLIYALSEGVGRTRGNAKGGLDQLLRWRNCFITNGEQPLTNAHSGAGAINRVLDLECTKRIFSDAPRVANGVREHYGFAGRRLVAALRDGDTRAALPAMYDGYYRAFEGYPDKQRMAAAMVMVGDALACDFVLDTDDYLRPEDLIPAFIRPEELDIAGRAYSWLLDWIAQNESKFRPSEFAECWGVRQRDGSYAIINKVFHDALQEAGFSPRAVLSGLSRRGLVDKDGAGKYTRPVRVGRPLTRCVILHPPADPAAELQEVDDNDSPFCGNVTPLQIKV